MSGRSRWEDRARDGFSPRSTGGGGTWRGGLRHGLLQLDFGNARFTAYVWPTVTIGDVTREFGDRGYRDALCALITHEVSSTEESPGAGLVIRFGLGEIVTNPEPTDLAGPEIAMLQVHEDAFREASWGVWRPGERVFSGRDWS
jgi:hypothetical protein